MVKEKGQDNQLEKEAQKIFSRLQKREEQGVDSFEATWQSSLEIILLMMQKPLLENLGQIIPMQIHGQKEWEFYIDVLEKLDLPPDICAVLITPSAFKDMPTNKVVNAEGIDPAALARNNYNLIVSHYKDRSVIMQVCLPGVASVGIDVYKNGKHFADYTYKSVEECLKDLTNVTWTFFNPKEKWSNERITRYTENWFSKTIHTLNLGNISFHTEYSYIHHPELIGISPLESAFKVVEATIPKELNSLDKAIEFANDLNQDLELGYPIITKEGILKNQLPECQTFFDRIISEIDQHLDTLEYLESVQFPNRNIKDPKFNNVFNDTAVKLYETITGQPCPDSISKDY